LKSEKRVKNIHWTDIFYISIPLNFLFLFFFFIFFLSSSILPNTNSLSPLLLHFTFSSPIFFSSFFFFSPFLSSLYLPLLPPLPLTVLNSSTHHTLNSLLYQLYTSFIFLCNPWQKHPLLQWMKYTFKQVRALLHCSPFIPSPLPAPCSSAIFLLPK
jgi:hypothetical protein